MFEGITGGSLVGSATLAFVVVVLGLKLFRAFASGYLIVTAMLLLTCISLVFFRIMPPIMLVPCILAVAAGALVFRRQIE